MVGEVACTGATGLRSTNGVRGRGNELPLETFNSRVSADSLEIDGDSILGGSNSAFDAWREIDCPGKERLLCLKLAMPVLWC